MSVRWSINNGRGRVEVSFGSYTGKAGVIDLDGRSEVALFGKLRDFATVTSGRIEGQPCKVLQVERSDDARAPQGMLRLTVTAVTPTA